MTGMLWQRRRWRVPVGEYHALFAIMLAMLSVCHQLYNL